MVDPERAAVSRYQVESQELRRGHRGLVTQLELIDRELERCTDLARQEELRAERARMVELVADSQARLRACWDRSRINTRDAGSSE